MLFSFPKQLSCNTALLPKKKKKMVPTWTIVVTARHGTKCHFVSIIITVIDKDVSLNRTEHKNIFCDTGLVINGRF